MKFIGPCPAKSSKRQISIAMFKGRMQYPNTQRLWKKEMFPPRSLEFSVMVTAPNQMITNTSANSGPPPSFFPSMELFCNINASVTQSINGPHRSQSLNSALLFLGYKTCINFLPTAFRSRIMVRRMDSFSVELSCSWARALEGMVISPSMGMSWEIDTSDNPANRGLDAAASCSPGESSASAILINLQLLPSHASLRNLRRGDRGWSARGRVKTASPPAPEAGCCGAQPSSGAPVASEARARAYLLTVWGRSFARGRSAFHAHWECRLEAPARPAVPQAPANSQPNPMEPSDAQLNPIEPRDAQPNPIEPRGPSQT